MHFSTLENQTISALTELFNHAFSDYFVSVKLTPDYLKNKILSENIELDKSVGIFSGQKPVGFILHATRTIDGERVAYNAGTGVIPEFRGNNATVKMYNYVLPVLKRNGVKKIFLEAIDENIQAIKSYEKVGFKKVVNLECFKGSVKIASNNKKVSTKELSFEDVRIFQNQWDWQPTWQHTFETVAKLNTYKTFGAFLNSTLIGYAILNPENGRTVQFVIDKKQRRKGVGTALFNKISELSGEEGLMVMNVDGNDGTTLRFLESIGLKHFLRQHKMEIILK